jgi:AraC-like DNA-binding protein
MGEQVRPAASVELPSDRPGEHLRFLRSPELPGVEVWSVERSDRLWRVYHESWAVCLPPSQGNPRGSSNEWWYRGRVQSGGLDMLMLTEPGELHVTRKVAQPTSFWVLDLPPTLVEAQARELGLSRAPNLRTWQTTAPDLCRAFARFFDAVAEGTTTLKLDERLAGCVQALLRCCEQSPQPTPPGVPPSLRRARDYLHAHFAEPVRLEELAALAGLSRFHLVRAFAQTYGMPPHAYQVQLRLAAARLQLRQGVPPALVDVGFADQSHLGRHFRRALGTSPAAYAGRSAVPPQAATQGRGRAKAAPTLPRDLR